MLLKKSTIYAVLKSLSPKRPVNSPKRGRRLISRSVSPEALAYLTSYLNNHLKAIVEACEQSLAEINNNPNSYYKQYRYDLRVVRNAIEKIKRKPDG